MARATQRSATQRMPAKARATTTRGTRGASSAAQVVEDPIIQRGIRACRQAMNAVLNAFPSVERPEIEAGFGAQFFGLRGATSGGQPRKQARALSTPRGGTRSATSTGRATKQPAKAPSRSRATNAAPSSGRGPQAGTRSARSSGAAGPKRTTTRAKRNQGFGEHQGQGQQAQGGGMENQQQP